MLKKIKKLIFISTLITSIYPIFAQQTNYLPDINQKLKSNIITNSQKLSNEKLIQNYCIAIKNSSVINTNLKYYPINPQKSIFFNSLCSYNDIIFDNTASSALNLDREKKHYLLLCKNLNSCDLFVLTNKLIKQVLSDLFAIKQGQIYGYNFEKKIEADKLAQNFLNTNFGINETNEVLNLKYFPDTFKIVKKFILKSSRLLSDIKILNLEKIVQQQISNENRKNIVITGNLLQYLKNGLFSEDYNKFQNIIFNEIFTYGLFVEFIKQNISINSTLSSIKQPGSTGTNREKEEYIKSINKDIVKIDKKTQLLNKYTLEYQNLKEITYQSLNDLYILGQSYQTHIGLLLYQEILKSFRNTLAKLIAPMYVLLIKFQNVQNKDE